MGAKTISLAEANLITWFNGQVSMIENQSGKKVKKLSLSIDRVADDGIQIELLFETPPEAPVE